MSDLLSVFNKLTPDTLTDYYQALYWYANLNHEGQFSQLYSILSTLRYKPSLTEKAEDVDFDSLGFPVSHDNMVLLATALRLWSVLQSETGMDEDRKFAKLHWFEAMDLYLAEYHDHDEVGFETYFLVYSVSSAGTIVNDTLPY